MAYIDTKYIGECETCRHHRNGKCDTWCDCGECYQPDMSKIPAADVEEVKHGKWTFAFWLARCSQCHYFSKIGYAPYCPNCGAKMDGGDTDGNQH